MKRLPAPRLTCGYAYLTLLDYYLTTLENMATRDILGGFEHRVLLATLHLGEGAFTANIVDELEERSGREVAPAAVYIALKRLEKRGLVGSEVRTEGGAGSVRPRRYFTVTPSGVDRLRDTRAELNRLWDGLDALGAG